MKTTVAVLGVGLIGGSIALSLRQNPDVRVVGFDVREDFLDKALTNGVIHAGTTDLQTAVRDADVIFLSAHVEAIYSLIDSLSELPLKPGAIVTDVGSTKSGVVAYARERFPHDVLFIGGHPMAGSHKSGVEAASERLFENAYYVLTPSAGTPVGQVEHLKALLTHTKAKIVVMEPDEHDQVVGAVSHFPHIIAAS
ncbi:prephenate dehydrogenase/arogenate dehydrogenase family protein, partial [Microbacteriaceae bacterium K1510]|nr:prephenate dehydrogenase/arogenate dehydrogenase family protein [Microbacteriaceae bacterium K1510]